MQRVTSVAEYIECVNLIRKRNDSRFVFRGQGNSEWTIQSTLERENVQTISCAQYYRDIDFLKPEINSLGYDFGRKITRAGYDFDFSKWNSIGDGQIPDLEYLTYLRHHKFPTPLIDVTQSEYIALFFACEEIRLQNSEGKLADAKVFAISRKLGASGLEDSPILQRVGHYINTDKRHIAQQSEYLLPVQFQKGDPGEWFFVPFNKFLIHETFIEASFNQKMLAIDDNLAEIVIAGEAKGQIMAELAKMNINHYTLYLNEDALVQKLKYEFLRKAK